MRISLFAIGILFLTSCQNSETKKPPSLKGLKISGLPEAHSSIAAQNAEDRWIEVVVDSKESSLYRNGILIADNPNLGDFKTLRDSINERGHSESLVVSAQASIPFGVITESIRSAAAAGTSEILFLVRDNRFTNQPRFIPLTLPTMDSSHVFSDIEPYFIQIDDKGRIFTGSGASQTRMDDAPNDRELEKLKSQLELFSAAAKSAGVKNAPCQIHVHPEASYQRMIDLLALMHQYSIHPFFSNLAPEILRMKKPESIQKKPSSPHGSVRKIQPK
jgi:biopolymer transport protein ExbD